MTGLARGRHTPAALAAIALVALASVPALAMSLALTEAQRADAIRAGEASVTTETFDAEWRVTDGRGDTAVVMTPFHRLLLAARHATFDGRLLKPAESERVLKQDAARLVVWVTLRGKTGSFARHLTATLLVGERTLKAAFTQNEHTPAPQEDGSYLARCIYGFPTQDLGGNASTVLAVADANGREVARFPIDLARMR